MRRSRRRLNLTSTDAALPARDFAFLAVLACRSLDDRVLVPVRARVLAAGGASRLDVARARERVFRAGASTETGSAFFFFLFLFTTGCSTGGLLLGILSAMGDEDTLGTDWVWSAIERVMRFCA